MFISFIIALILSFTVLFISLLFRIYINNHIEYIFFVFYFEYNSIEFIFAL
nr:MAG TPA: hypothetical protein [Caudoviricetes sp.]